MHGREFASAVELDEAAGVSFVGPDPGPGSDGNEGGCDHLGADLGADLEATEQAGEPVAGGTRFVAEPN